MFSPATIAFIACRILALYLLSENLTSIIQFVRSIAVPIYRGWVIQPVDYEHWAALVAVPTIMVLWFGAGWLSSRIAPNLETTQADGRWTRENLMSCGVVLTGLLLLLWAVPSLVAAGYYYTHDETSSLYIEQLIYAVPQIVLALICLAGPSYIAKFLAFLRQWDSDRSS